MVQEVTQYISIESDGVKEEDTVPDGNPVMTGLVEKKVYLSFPDLANSSSRRGHHLYTVLPADYFIHAK